MNEFSPKQLKDLKVLITFTQVYCHAKHHGINAPVELPPHLGCVFKQGVHLCSGCAGFLAYALEKRRLCPLDPKPSCKHCSIHCYSNEYRQQAREIMAFSGRRLIMRGRIDYLWHFFS